MNPPGLISIVGATATGKTGIAIELAQQLGAPILSADSRQVYRNFDIGTAKPTLAERQDVPHYLIDLAEPNTNFTVAEYQIQAQELIATFHAQGITPILVGGTGLYIRSILRGMTIPRVAPQMELRSQLMQLGQSQCYAMLQQVDPASAKAIHANDRVRTLRSLEVFYVTGIALSAQQAELPPTYPIHQIGITSPDRSVHQQWIIDRIDKMLQNGWLEEIQQLQTKYGKDLALLRTLGYAEMSDFLDRKTTLAEAKDLAALHTLQFAKRQKTWFNGAGNVDRAIHWISPTTSPISLIDLAETGAREL